MPVTHETVGIEVPTKTILETAIFDEAIAIRGIMVRSANRHFRAERAFTGLGRRLAMRGSQLPEVVFGSDPRDSGLMTISTRPVVMKLDSENLSDSSFVRGSVLRLTSGRPGTGREPQFSDESYGDWGHSPLRVHNAVRTLRRLEDGTVEASRAGVNADWASEINLDRNFREISTSGLMDSARTEPLSVVVQEAEEGLLALLQAAHAELRQ